VAVLMWGPTFVVLCCAFMGNRKNRWTQRHSRAARALLRSLLAHHWRRLRSCLRPAFRAGHGVDYREGHLSKSCAFRPSGPRLPIRCQDCRPPFLSRPEPVIGDLRAPRGSVT
jgi:hypothetical protein